MFSIDQLSSDGWINKHLSSLLISEIDRDRALGKYLEDISLNDFIKKLCKATYEKMKYLPSSGLTIFKTTDLGIGYNNNLSLSQLTELMFLGKIKEDIPIVFEYRCGNIFSYIDKKDLDIKVLLTDESYVTVKESIEDLWYLRIGKPVNCNRLYSKEELDGVKGTLKELSKIDGFNCVWIR